jgi:hypothetical protein
MTIINGTQISEQAYLNATRKVGNILPNSNEIDRVVLFDNILVFEQKRIERMSNYKANLIQLLTTLNITL